MDELIKAFQAQGYEVALSHRTVNILIIRGFRIQAGRDAGKIVDVGFPIGDYPNTPPSAVYFTPALDPPKQGGVQATCPLGPEWTYWSRRVNNWTDDRSAKHLITWLNSVFYYE